MADKSGTLEEQLKELKKIGEATIKKKVQMTYQK